MENNLLVKIGRDAKADARRLPCKPSGSENNAWHQILETYPVNERNHMLKVEEEEKK